METRSTRSAPAADRAADHRITRRRSTHSLADRQAALGLAAAGRAVLAGRLKPRNLTSSTLDRRSRRQSATSSSPMWPSRSTRKYRPAEALLGGPRLELGQVDRPGRELLQDREQRARPVGALEDDHRRLVVAGRRLDAVAGDDDEAGGVVGVGPRCRWPSRRGRRPWRPPKGRWRPCGRPAQGRRRAGRPRRWTRWPPPPPPGAALAPEERPALRGGHRDAQRRRHAHPAWGRDRFICTPITTSRWISRSVSNARLSTVTVTAPSIEFSTATKPGRPVRPDGGQHLGDGREGRRARAGEVGL